MKYFSILPKIKYTFDSGEYTVVDLFTKVVFNNNFFNNNELYYEELLNRVQKPERMSFTKYENFDYYWLLMLANNVIDVNQDWPEEQEDFGRTLEQNSNKVVYYIYDHVEAIENDILYVNDFSYGVIESWNPFYKSITIKENYNLPSQISGVNFKIKRIINGQTVDLNNTCSENSTTLTAFGRKLYLESPNKIMMGDGKNLNAFSKVVSSNVTNDLILDTCDASDKTEFQQTLIYKIVNNISVNNITIETQEQRLVKEYVDRIKLNVINPVYVPLMEDKVKLLINNPTEESNIFSKIN